MSIEYNEDNLVEQAASNIFEKIGWEVKRAWKDEVFGVDGTLGRENKSEIILQKYLIPNLKKLNPNLPEKVYKEAYNIILEKQSGKKLDKINKEKYQLFKSGIKINYTNSEDELTTINLKVFDFDNFNNNHFLAVRQFEVQGELYLRRPDIVGFINGIPLIFLELKSIHKDLRHAYEDNLKDYKDTIPDLFNFNAFIILSNGLKTNVGTITSPYKFFHEWKRINEEDEGDISLSTTIIGTCSKDKVLDLFENFILHEDSGGDVIKIFSKIQLKKYFF